MGFIWSALCSSLWADDFIGRSGFNNISSDIYYLAFPNDPLRRKLLVYAVYVAEMVQAIMLARMAYIQFAAGFGNFDALDAIPATLWFGVPILSSIGMYHPPFWPFATSILVAAVVQIFYAYRIKLLSESYLIPSVIVLVSFVFIHLESLVLICVVGIIPARRRDHTRCTVCEDSIFFQGVRQEDIYRSWRKCSQFFPKPLVKLWITNLIDLVWR